MPHSDLSFYEFFAGGGMARLGLGERWRCTFANDVDPVKADAYRANFKASHLHVGDVWALAADDLPGQVDLAWASSPCQDLSLAGLRRGLGGARSSAFFGFWRLVEGLAAQGRAPAVVVIENVGGLLTSAEGADFAGLCALLAGQGYRMGALEIDAALFTPQSRPRLFVVATRGPVATGLRTDGPQAPFHGPRLIKAVAGAALAVRHAWVWWRLPVPAPRDGTLAQVLDPAAAWAPSEQALDWLSHLSPVHRRRLGQAGGEVGTGFRRIRVEDGRRVQRLELRFDGMAGCLRTPAGGSSRPFVVAMGPDGPRARRMTPREAARLMGLPDSYVLPPGQTAALKVLGDGVCAPLVRHLAEHLLAPLACDARGGTQRPAHQHLSPLAAE